LIIGLFSLYRSHWVRVFAWKKRDVDIIEYVIAYLE